ncbi:hypothetical protein [Pontibacter chitinilyticus]|uniref:hypothetical protein n=1 Tax=Pontibacter chitinilyticus TaxID=2674989 RepID=UPI00321BC29C
MKQHVQYLILSLVLLFVAACQQKEKVPDLDKIETEMGKEAPAAAVDSSSQKEVEQVNEALAKECQAYWAEQQKLDSAKVDYFSTVVLPKALANPALTAQNRMFLLALQQYLQQSPEERHSTLTTSQVLFPIFKLEKNELGVLGFPAYDQNDQTFQDISLENKVLLNSKLTGAVDTAAKNKIVLHPALADSLFKNTSEPLYAFTTGRRTKTKVVNFGSFANECLEYYNYLLDTKPFKATDKVLFGSPYNLDLVYAAYPSVDQLMQQQLKPACFDCPTSSAQEKTFAALKGVNSLYFTYADTFPLNNQLQTPSRGLLMVMDGKIVYLWYAEVDRVGCSCI